jgi:putative ABC transport system permease protein
MKTILLQPLDLSIAASLVIVDIGLSIALRLRLHRQIALAAARMVVQLVMIGYVLKFVFALDSPIATAVIVMLMVLVAAREVAARPDRSLIHGQNYLIGLVSVAGAATLASVFALITAIRPDPWFDPHYAIPLVGIILGSVLNAGSIALDSVLGDVEAAQPGIEARLMLGHSYWAAMASLIRGSIRRGMLPIINQMSAAGIITLPGIMTGQILAGLDPIEAVKYQILLMFLLSGASGLVAVAVAYAAAWRLTDHRQRLRLDHLR